jgi:quinol monooxygenase YgiN
MSVAVVVRFTAAKGKAGALRPLLEQGRDNGRSAPGCEQLVLWQSTQDAHIFMLFEQWASLADHARNLTERVRTDGNRARVMVLLAGPPESQTFDLLG